MIPWLDFGPFTYLVWLLGWSLPVLLGLLGWWIDGLLGTGPVFLALLAGFGVASSFASARYRYERRIAQHDDGKPWARSRPKATS